MPAPIFNFEFSSSHRPAVSSPLSSSPLRPSQSSPPLSSRDPNTLPRLDTQSSPIQTPPSKLFKFASRSAKPNPLRQNRENAQEGRRKLFLKNVRQRADDKKWDRRGGDQEALKLEWSTLDRRRRQQKDTDLDGIVFEDEIDGFPDPRRETPQDSDHMMVDAVAQDEQDELDELDAMLAMYETESSQQPPARPDSPSLSDDEDYDSLFMDLLSQQGGENSQQDFASSGQMDVS